jgi:glyoxylase-like metal-dependent hydrolase (beta-lactamase superfamily II)
MQTLAFAEAVAARHDGFMAFLQEDVPPRGVAQDVMPGIRRVVADNPGVMTYHGTNSFLIEEADGLTVIDPGPKSLAHTEDILRAAGDVPVLRILLTHSHADHWGGVADLHARTGAPVAAYAVSARAGFAPDLALNDGTHIGGFKAVHTPGHAADHLCYEFYTETGVKVLFSGDHVMSWSSSIVSPPEGDMLDYYRSLEKLLARDDDVYLSAHGPLLERPRELVAEMLAHRKARERSILAALNGRGWSIAALAQELYHKTDPMLKAAAQRNVLAHLLKLKAEGRAVEHEPEAELHDDTLVMAEALSQRFGRGGKEGERLLDDSRRCFALSP